MTEEENKHPYTYITPENFEVIQNCFKFGMGFNKTPDQIIVMLMESTNLPEDVAKALVQLELLPTMQKLRTMEINKDMPKGSKFKYDV